MTCKKSDRQQTNSLTHLTKILVKEVLDDHAVLNRIQQQDVRLGELLGRIEAVESAIQLEDIPPSNRQGQVWETFEDMSLTRAFNRFIERRARIHGRTSKAICERLRHQYRIG